MFKRTLIKDFWQGLQSKDVIMKVKSQIWRLLRNYKEKLTIGKASEILINETIIKSNEIVINNL